MLTEQEKMDAMIAELAEQEGVVEEGEDPENSEREPYEKDLSEQEKMDAMIAELAKQEGVPIDQEEQEEKAPNEENTEEGIEPDSSDQGIISQDEIDALKSESAGEQKEKKEEVSEKETDRKKGDKKSKEETEQEQLEAVLADISKQVSFKDSELNVKENERAVVEPPATNVETEQKHRPEIEKTDAGDSESEKNVQPSVEEKLTAAEYKTEKKPGRKSNWWLRISLAACFAFAVWGIHAVLIQYSEPLSRVSFKKIGDAQTILKPDNPKKMAVKSGGPSALLIDEINEQSGSKAEIQGEKKAVADGAVSEDLKTDKLRVKMTEIMFLKGKISDKIIRAEEKRNQVKELINSLSEEILLEQNRLVLKTFKTAKQSSRISYNLKLIVQLIGYNVSFDQRIAEFKACEEKLYYLHQQAQDDYRIIKTLNDLEVEELIRRIDKVLDKYFPQTKGPLISAETSYRYDSEKIWQDIVNKKL